ncbi:MAG: hypothetical protein ACRCXX_13870 [Cetobacterium sp.]|uniref:hypothetical protein n=1 Tax=Cetobacterium sp. TaxID=2071632 RepID=UPI003F31D332
MANWCTNEIRFDRPLTLEQRIKLMDAIGIPGDYEVCQGDLKDCTIRPYALMDKHYTIEHTEVLLRKELLGNPYTTEEIITLFHQVNPLGLPEKELLKWCLNLEIGKEIKSLIRFNGIYGQRLEEMHRILSTFKREELIIKNKVFLPNRVLPNEKGFHSIELDSFLEEVFYFDTRWTQVSENWFTLLVLKVDNVLGRDVAQGMTLYYEEIGEGYSGRYEVSYSISKRMFLINNNENYSEIEEDEYEEEE